MPSVHAKILASQLLETRGSQRRLQVMSNELGLQAMLEAKRAKRGVGVSEEGVRVRHHER